MTPETLLRLVITAGLLAALMALEALLPARQRLMPRLARWTTNLSLGMISSLMVRLMGPATAAGAALAAARWDAGLFDRVSLPGWLTLVIVIILMDFAIWAQHVAMHRVPLLWRLHRVHHTDRDLDATSGLRFHPAEAMLSMAWKAAVVFLLGAPVEAVFVYEIALGAMALFTHANFRLPAALDKRLRWLIVTPEMHRIHHSVVSCETNSNYGNILSLWDRMLRTYTAQAAAPLTLGLTDWQDNRPASLAFVLALPFARAIGQPRPKP